MSGEGISDFRLQISDCSSICNLQSDHSPNPKEPPMHPAEQRRLLADVDSFCQELREHEELCYVEHRFNHHLIPLAQKYNLLGMPVPADYQGRGADAVTYAKAL